ncbi:hypothetical protein [Larsenimonas rhizosphaerae]|nr:hypothetical protein [Larsenimonas rhizosphaerae]MCM2131769.1 hypothetical protein [Larsenimonas rhizosphaerae]
MAVIPLVVDFLDCAPVDVALGIDLRYFDRDPVGGLDGELPLRDQFALAL